MIRFENEIIREIQHSWHEFNISIFGKSLRLPSFKTHLGKSRLGYWSRQDRMISLSIDFIQSESWYRVLSVLKHEMLHQFIDESMGYEGAEPHGPIFQSLCKKFQIESFEEVGLSAYPETSPILEKIKKLLSLAESPNVHEAENAMKLANQMMLKWNVQHLERESKRDFMFHHLGRPGRITLPLKMLSQILRDFFFVEVLWVNSFNAETGKSGKVLEICGKKENIEISEYVYDYLIFVSAKYWTAYKNQYRGAHKGNYIYGLYLGFYEKLDEQNRSAEEKNELVWLGDPLLHEYFKKKHPRVRKLSSSSMKLDEMSFDAGKKQGQKIVIRKGVTKSSSPQTIQSGMKGLLS